MGKWFQRWFWRNHISVTSQEINPGWNLQVVLPAVGFGSQMLFHMSMATGKVGSGTEMGRGKDPPHKKQNE